MTAQTAYYYRATRMSGRYHVQRAQAGQSPNSLAEESTVNDDMKRTLTIVAVGPKYTGSTSLVHRFLCERRKRAAPGTPSDFACSRVTGRPHIPIFRACVLSNVLDYLRRYLA